MAGDEEIDEGEGEGEGDDGGDGDEGADVEVEEGEIAPAETVKKYVGGPACVVPGAIALSKDVCLIDLCDSLSRAADGKRLQTAQPRRLAANILNARTGRDK